MGDSEVDDQKLEIEDQFILRLPQVRKFIFEYRKNDKSKIVIVRYLTHCNINLNLCDNNIN